MERIVIAFGEMRFVLHVVLREIFCGKTEKLTRRWRQL